MLAQERVRKETENRQWRENTRNGAWEGEGSLQYHRSQTAYGTGFGFFAGTSLLVFVITQTKTQHTKFYTIKSSPKAEMQCHAKKNLVFQNSFFSK